MTIATVQHRDIREISDRWDITERKGEIQKYKNGKGSEEARKEESVSE